MSLKDDFSRVMHDPRLVCKVPGALAAKYARFVFKKQLYSKASSLDTSGIDRDHYAWTSINENDIWDLFCVQETNLVNFLKTYATDDYGVVAEIGATSDIFLKHVTAKRKIGINILDACVDQLNRQGICGMKTDGNKMPLADSEADLVICFETLEHVDNPISFLTELSRIAKNKILLSIPWVLKTNIRAQWHGLPGPSGQPDSEYHRFEFNCEDFRKILSYTDLKVTRYQELISYKAKYDPFTNWCMRKNLFFNYFPAIQAYVLEKKAVKS